VPKNILLIDPLILKLWIKLLNLERFIIIGHDELEDWNDDGPIYSANQSEWKQELKRQKRNDQIDDLSLLVTKIKKNSQSARRIWKVKVKNQK
jgi:thymidylate synthase